MSYQRGKNLGKNFRPRQKWESEQKCMIDPNHETYILRGFPKWTRYKDGWLCGRCYGRLISSPRAHAKLKEKRRLKGLENIENIKNRNNKNTKFTRISFKDERIYTGKTIRTGYCSRCTNNIFDGSSQQTHLHHHSYNNSDFLDKTEELCASCHAIETWKTRKKK